MANVAKGLKLIVRVARQATRAVKRIPSVGGPGGTKAFADVRKTTADLRGAGFL